MSYYYMETEKARGIQVELKQAEKIRRYLYEKNLLRADLKIYKDDNFIYLPIKRAAKELKFKKLAQKKAKKINEKMEEQEDSATSGIGMIFD